ncbi:Ribokinase-like protein [Pholiota molesta]|nr:Ribokinase-like protein [Pholiota molesta]
MHLDGPVVLTIAGSDSGGGAGIQADLKTTRSACRGPPLPPEFVEKQITSVLADLNVRAIKTGMLYDAANAKVVATVLKAHFASTSVLLPLVCDPVCVSTSGHSLLHPDAVKVLISHLFPLSTVITPNKAEAELLLSHLGHKLPINNLLDMIFCAVKLSMFGCQAVIKHGMPGDNMEILLVASPNYDALELVVDVLCERYGSITIFIRPRIESSSTHGTGCTLSSAIASELAKGIPLAQAVNNATIYTHHGIQTASAIGGGHGPLNHFHGLTPLFIPRPTATNPYPFTQMLIESTAKDWKDYVEHEFVQQAGKGTLDRACFIHFVKQDYLYLKYYARAYALLAAKTTSFGQIESATKTILNVLHEVGNHKAFCAKFDISEAELDTTPEATATTAYGAYIMDTGLQGDTTKLLMALMACLLGYGEVGLWLKKQSTLPDTWMYQEAVRLGLETIEACAVKEWKAVWAKCTRLEKGFWDMAMELRY